MADLERVDTRRGVLRTAAAGALATLPALGTHAQGAYPTRVVRFVLPFSPGGPSDLIARILAAEFEKRFGQPFIVESRPGAASNIGTVAVARAEPDGHTLLIAANNLMINPALYRNAGYDPTKDFAPITVLAATPCIIVAEAKTGIRTMDELVARDRADPGRLNYSTPGVGTPNHLVFELISAHAKLKLVHVPYQGGAPSAQAVLAGTTQVASSLLPNVLGHIQSGALNALAVSGRERLAELPDTPTLLELGYSDISTEIVFMLLAPAGTPAAIVERLAKETAEVLNGPDARGRLRSVGFTVRTAGPAELRDRIAAETIQFARVVRELGLSAP